MTGNGHEGPAYDVAVIGSGFTGSVLAAVLARNGVRTLLADERAHPRFAVGETMVPYAAALARLVARRYRVPEIESVSTLKGVRGVTERCGVMKNVGFVRHSEGLRQHPGEIYQVVNPSIVPEGPHLFREDTDAHLFDAAVSYGADARTGPGARIDAVHIDPDTGVTLRTADGEELRAHYVVDAGGQHSLLARQLGLREEPARTRHHSRCLFTHMTGVIPYDRTEAGRAHHQPSPWHDGTLHHVFDGGWLWVIPFGNRPQAAHDLCSVGLVLDPRRHPDQAASPQAEFEAVIAEYPDLAAQFGQATAVRPWVRTERLQYSSRQLVGDRYCLAGEASGFVDPLYARGLVHDLETVNALAWRLIAASRDGDFSARRFRYVEELQQGLLDVHDDLAYASFVAFGDPALFDAVVRTWTMGTVLGALVVENALAAFARERDDSVFRALEQNRYPGSPFPADEHYNALGPLARSLCAEVEAGTLPPRVAADRLFEAIRQVPSVPPPLGLGDPAERFFHNTPARIVRAARWARTEASDEIGALLKGAMGGLVRERLGSARRHR